MGRQIYVNLPVHDLPRARSFFAALGFTFEPRFSNDQAACMIIADDIFAMLLVETFFAGFTKKSICNTRDSTEVLLCLSCGSRGEVDELVAKAVGAGGRIAREAKDHGFMYEHAFEDLDGHTWELVYMEPDAAPA